MALISSQIFLYIHSYLNKYIYIIVIFLFADEEFLSIYADDTTLCSIQNSLISNQSVVKKI